MEGVVRLCRGRRRGRLAGLWRSETQKRKIATRVALFLDRPKTTLYTVTRACRIRSGVHAVLHTNEYATRTVRVRAPAHLSGGSRALHLWRSAAIDRTDNRPKFWRCVNARRGTLGHVASDIRTRGITMALFMRFADVAAPASGHK